MNRNMQRGLLLAAACLGVAVIAAASFCVMQALYGHTQGAAQSISSVADSVPPTSTPAPSAPASSSLPASSAQPEHTEVGALRYGDTLGTVKVEDTEVDCALFFGDSETQLGKGVGMYAEAGIPGSGGTMLVAGHTGSFFRDLEHAELEKEIVVETYYGVYHYRITEMKVVEATDSTAYDLAATEENLILYTCYPFGQLGATPLRYFVYAELVSGPRVTDR